MKKVLHGLFVVSFLLLSACTTSQEVVLPEIEELPEHLKGEEVVTITATEE